jgi:hypothetical protein
VAETEATPEDLQRQQNKDAEELRDDTLRSGVSTDSDAKNKKREKEDSVRMKEEDKAVTQPVPMATPAAKPQPMPKAKTSRRNESLAGETRGAGGKTFRNVGGIWFDSAYTSQPQTTVRRGTGEYQRLDSGLRSIADSLGGTVVVLWKVKAYRIQ